MAYIAPHKRHSRDMEKPSPTAEKLSTHLNRKLSLNPSGRNIGRHGQIVYADKAVSKWFSIGSSDDGNLFPSCVRLEQFCVPSNECRRGEKPLALVNSTNISQGSREEEDDVVTEPWVSIVVNLLPDLLSSAEHIKNEMNQDEGVKLKLVARIGKILFHGRVQREVDRSNLRSETTLRQVNWSFYTSVPETYMENIADKVIPLIGVEFDKEKVIYNVKLSDSEHPSLTLSCKCSAVPELNILKLYKVELNKVRHMVADVSCLKQNVDMRVMLCSKKILEKLTDDEMEGIEGLINSAVLDQNVKGGLRWPLGKATSGDRFRVVGVWHTVAKSYVNPFIRLKLRNADRYDFKTSTGETSNEVTVKLKQIASELLREKAEDDVISDMLKDHLKLFWNHFVCSASNANV